MHFTTLLTSSAWKVLKPLLSPEDGGSLTNCALSAERSIRWAEIGLRTWGGCGSFGGPEVTSIKVSTRKRASVLFGGGSEADRGVAKVKRGAGGNKGEKLLFPPDYTNVDIHDLRGTEAGE